MEDRDTILVAGKTRQLAHALTELAAARGLPLTAVGCPTLDIEDANSIEAVLRMLRPKIIINAAAYTAVDRAEVERERAFSVNRDGAARLAMAAAQLGVPYIHVSTDYVFDGQKTDPYCENDVTAPLNVYGRSKLEGEAAVREAHPAGLILRTSWLYSSWGHNFLLTMIRLAKTRDMVRVVDDQRGTPTSATDLAKAILQIADQIVRKTFAGHFGTYHLTAQGETTWHGFAKAIFEDLAMRGWRVPKIDSIRTAEYPSPAMRPSNSRLDCAKIAKDFGVRLPHWRASLDACLANVPSVAVEA